MFSQLIIFALIVVLILNFLIYCNLDKISSSLNIFDQPDNRLKKHKFNTPMLGGIILAVNIIFFVFIYFFLLNDFKQLNISLKKLFSISILLTSFFIIGLIDDKFKSKPENKFFLCIFFSLFCLLLNKDLLILNIKFSFLNHVIFLDDFSYLFTIFCFVILINALNFYDGVNGQSIIYFIFVFCYLLIKSDYYLFYILLILILFFIFILNISNKIFMGDNGIYLSGSIVIAALIYEYNVFKSIQFAEEIFLLLILPGYDLLRLTIVRLYNGKNPFYGDRNHIHHLLLNNFSILETNLILFLLSIIPILLFSLINLNFILIIFLYTTFYIYLIYKL